MVNPFSTKFWSPGVLPFQFSEPGETMDAVFEQSRRYPICQIVGPHGSGKSTLLLGLLKRYEENGDHVWHLLFNDQQRRIPDDLTFPKNQILFVDGMEQLSWWNQFRLRFRSKHLIVTAHHPIWFMPVLYRTNPQWTVFVQIVRQLLPDLPQESVLRTVYERSGGNFRNAFFELYDQWEKRRERNAE